ncbi:thiamine biosynthesis protein [Corynebacterium sp. 35RC1]|nr:thiamine biosynthesis protein [Corynebacterium sp. 35RC1]
MAYSRRRSLTLAGAALVVGSALAACHPPSEVDSELKVNTATGVAAPTQASTTTSAEAGAEAEENVEISLPNAQLTEGQQFSFTVTGLLPEGGYYAAICSAEDSDVPACTGIQTDPANQAWLNNASGNVAIDATGAAAVTLTATATGEDLDCTTDDCVLKVFGDQNNDFEPKAEVPVTFTA